MTWGVIPGWAETIWSIEVMALGLVSKGFLIDPPDCLPWYYMASCGTFQKKTGDTRGVGYLILLNLPGIIYLLDILMRYLKDQWFGMWCQTLDLSNTSSEDPIGR